MAHPVPKYLAIGAGLTLVEDLMRGAFDRVRDPRSEAYKLGARELLKCRALGIAIRCPYSMGTAESDAFYAGKDEGCLIWRQHLAANTQCVEVTIDKVC